MKNPVQEHDRIAGRAVTAILLAVLAFAGISTFLAWALWWQRLAHLAPLSPEPPPEAPVAIDGIEQTLFDATQLGQALRERQKIELGSFSWADRDRRLVRLPIDVAMELKVRESGP